ncbi:hypothetical protein B0T19DRAFT_297088 [Cercophora scortea]|uniref:Uncharacterized protein n=1 Tax=Cercophora scortea TaxID=314031 RepID=A0AAE0M3W1_9PEZI|nr:hypothetical protein B0T19DRAFT_297088 [Cercophora scortea]
MSAQLEEVWRLPFPQSRAAACGLGRRVQWERVNSTAEKSPVQCFVAFSLCMDSAVGVVTVACFLVRTRVSILRWITWLSLNEKRWSGIEEQTTLEWLALRLFVSFKKSRLRLSDHMLNASYRYGVSASRQLHVLSDLLSGYVADFRIPETFGMEGYEMR